MNASGDTLQRDYMVMSLEMELSVPQRVGSQGP